MTFSALSEPIIWVLRARKINMCTHRKPFASIETIKFNLIMKNKNLYTQTINQPARIYHAAHIKYFVRKFPPEKKPETFHSWLCAKEKTMDDVRLLHKRRAKWTRPATNFSSNL